MPEGAGPRPVADARTAEEARLITVEPRLAAGRAIRVVSYNVRHGQGVASLVSLRRTARTIAAIAPDIVAANELYRWPGRYDQPGTLARLLDMHVSFQANVIFGRIEYGNALFSREPLRLAAEVDLPHRWERRGLLLAETRVGGADVIAGVTHLSLRRETRAQQVAAIAETFAGLGDRPAVLCGDLNADLRELGPLTAVLRCPDAPPSTYHALLPRVAIDHVLWSRHFEEHAVAAVRSLASDHLPVYVDLMALRTIRGRGQTGEPL